MSAEWSIGGWNFRIRRARCPWCGLFLSATSPVRHPILQDSVAGVTGVCRKHGFVNAEQYELSERINEEQLYARFYQPSRWERFSDWLWHAIKRS